MSTDDGTPDAPSPWGGFPNPTDEDYAMRVASAIVNAGVVVGRFATLLDLLINQMPEQTARELATPMQRARDGLADFRLAVDAMLDKDKKLAEDVTRDA